MTTTVAGGALASAGTVAPVTAQESTDLDGFSWPTLNGGRRLAGATAIEGIESTSESAYSLGGNDRTTVPVVDDGTAYAGSDGDLVAADLASGAGEWAFRGEEPFMASPAVGAESVIAVTTEGTVLAVDRDTGEERWSLGVSGQPGAPTIRDETAYVADSEGTVYAFATSSGELEWSKALDARFDTDGNNAPGLLLPAVAVGEESLYVNVPDSQAPPSRLVALSFEGEVEWEYSIEASVLSPPAVTEGGVVVKTQKHLRLVSSTGGVEQWAVDLRGEAHHPLAAGNGLVAVVDDDPFEALRCNAYDLETGELRWRYSLEEGRRSGGATIAGGMVYFVATTGSRSGTVVGVGLEDGLERFSIDVDNPAIGYGPVPVPDGIFVPDGTSSRLVTTEAFDGRSAEETDSTSEETSEETSTEDGGSDGGSTAADDDGGGSITDEESSATDESGATTDDSGWNLPSLSVIESVIVITTSLASALYGAIRVAARSEK
ncbi:MULTISPECIES: PQQ-binding-like beta-propeller repeat protein [Haloferacaceae]|uniref:PQQ-binding-like beta-propeller repeat protein n=1 Tax=Halorubrum glutamatedens TaxID=2707018 RepID=A0ABD5QP75_9EURY|nr:PQQ-binding-like beta-propeller repeat protein [Halobellus captivus]